MDDVLAALSEHTTHGALGKWAHTTLGGDGEYWLDALPNILQDLSGRWQFIPTVVHPASLRSLVVTGYTGTSTAPAQAALKVEPQDCTASLTALTVFEQAGVGPVVLASAPEVNAYLLEWLTGHPMPTGEHASRASLSATVRTVQQIAAADTPPAGVPTFAEKIRHDVAITRHLLSSIPEFARPFDDALLGYDLDMAALVQSTYPQVLVHGDLIPKNTLQQPDGTLKVFDPTPCTGPVEFDLAHLCARIDAGARIKENLDHVQDVAAGLGLVVETDLLGWLTAHTARVYYAYKVAMRQNVSGDYLPLVRRPTFEH